MPVVGITHSSRKVVPGAPTIGTATDVGTARAYNDGAITITFTPADLYATSFTASAYDNLAAVTRTATGSASPLTITGFRSTSAATVTVTASNAIGTSGVSSASNSVTVTTVPQAPATIGTLSANGSASLSLNTWGSVTNTSPSNGGKTISGYRARLFPGSLSSATGDLGSPGATVWNSLTAGNSYTANAYAVNANGESAASPSSNSATVGLAPVLSTNPTFTDSGNQVTLSSGTWANSPTSYTYQIATSLANLNAGTYVLNSTTTNSSATYTGSYSTTYHGKVTATNAYGSTTSGNFTATTGANLAPAISGNFPILSQPNASVPELSLSKGDWTNSPTGYIYYLQLNGSVIATHPSSGTTTATSYLFTGLQYNTEYGGAVTAVNAYGNPQATSNAYTTAAYVPPPTPTPTGTISASNVTSSQATATFTVSNAASWDVRSSYIGGAFYLSGLNPSPSSPLTVSPVPTGATGVALVLNMWTGASRTGTLYQVSTTYDVPTAYAAPSTPGYPTNSYSAGPTWSGSWTASTGSSPITYYWVFYQSTSNGGTPTLQGAGSTTGTSFTFSGSSANGLWGYFTVYANNSTSNNPAYSSAAAQSNWA